METWLKRDEDQITIKSAAPKGYDAISFPRQTDRRGGGLAAIYDSSKIALKKHETYNFDSCEMADLKFKIGMDTVVLCLIYRPPHLSVMEFLQDLTTYFEININQNTNQIFLGDLNIQINNNNSADATNLKNFLEMFDLSNEVKFPMHKSGHTLDLIIHQELDCKIETSQGDFISDHCFVNVQPSQN